MIRRLSASFFFLGMIALLLFQQPAFSYCSHTNQFFMNDCGCERQVGNSCPHCPQEHPSEPCDECSEKIQVDVDELVWFDVVADAPKMACCPFVQGSVDATKARDTMNIAASPVRPPPPPPGVSLLLLHSVFRL